MKRILSLMLPMAALLAGAVLLADEPLPDNPLLEQFLKKGIDVPAYGAFKLPKPTVREGMSPAELDAAIKTAAGDRPLSQFLERGQFKPINLKVTQVYDADKTRVAQYVKLHFVAYGKLETVLKKNLLNQLIGGAKGKSNTLDEGQLKKRDLTLLKSKGFQEQYDVLDMELLEKVSVSGITRSIKTTSDKIAYSTTILDERFVKDAQHPNVWQHVNANGMLIGKPSPYAGMGGYVVALELPKPKGALYMEMHYILHEPKGWFGGQEVLRSKLPILIRDNVHEFRRKLAKEG